MNKETGNQVWMAPKLEQIAMVGTAAKGGIQSENQGDSMTMSPSGMKS